MPIDKFRFHIIFNKILLHIENTLDSYSKNIDIDYEINNQIMTISFSKTNKIIISKQESIKQIWLANKNTGYHFNYKNLNWLCSKTNKNFWDILEESLFIQGKKKIHFSRKMYEI